MSCPGLKISAAINQPLGSHVSAAITDSDPKTQASVESHVQLLADTGVAEIQTDDSESQIDEDPGTKDDHALQTPPPYDTDHKE